MSWMPGVVCGWGTGRLDVLPLSSWNMFCCFPYPSGSVLYSSTDSRRSTIRGSVTSKTLSRDKDWSCVNLPTDTCGPSDRVSTTKVCVSLSIVFPQTRTSQSPDTFSFSSGTNVKTENNPSKTCTLLSDTLRSIPVNAERKPGLSCFEWRPGL